MVKTVVSLCRYHVAREITYTERECRLQGQVRGPLLLANSFMMVSPQPMISCSQ